MTDDAKLPTEPGYYWIIRHASKQRFKPEVVLVYRHMSGKGLLVGGQTIEGFTKDNDVEWLGRIPEPSNTGETR